MSERNHGTDRSAAEAGETAVAEEGWDSEKKTGREALTRQQKHKTGTGKEEVSGQNRGKQKRDKRQEAIVEAVLFTMGESVELRQLAAAIEGNEGEARQAVESLKQRYDKEKRGIQIIELDGCYQMCTRVEYYENLIHVAATPKKHMLTDVVLETLSIIAYKQPVTKLEIEKIRGVKSDHAVNRLVEYNLVQEVGRLDAPGRPALFATTEEFLRRFGIGSREELPDMDPVQAEELRNEVEEELNLHMDEENHLD